MYGANDDDDDDDDARATTRDDARRRDGRRATREWWTRARTWTLALIALVAMRGATRAKTTLRTRGRAMLGEFELPEDLDAYVDAMEFDEDAYAALGSARDGEIVPGAEPKLDAMGGEDGVFVSTEGGKNATLLRIKMLKMRLRELDDENLENDARESAVWRAAVDEGATQPAPVNVTSYAHKLQEEIEQDKAVLELHEAMLSARLGGGWKKSAGDVVGGASNANGAVVANAIDSEFCWKGSYGRGVGRLPSHCPSNKETLAGGVLCYTKCHHLGNYDRFGYDCHQRCGHGWSDDGLLCRKGNHGRGVGTIQCGWDYWASSASTLGERKLNGRRLLGNKAKTRLVCGGKFCGHGKQDCLGLCYPPCPSSHPHWIGCNLCGVDCAGNGYAAGIAPSCPKKIHCSHGLQAATCPPGFDNDAGLCYERCKSGFTGVGPVCWGDAPTVNGKKWVHCGMGAATDDAACGAAVTNQVLGPLEIVAFVATAGSSGAATTGPKVAARAGTKVAGSGGKLAALKKAASGLNDNMEIVGTITGLNSAINNALNAQTETDAIRAAAEIAAAFDPSGVSSTVSAYAFDTCDKIHNKAD